ncbi:hypothetical protein C8P66_112119 [Humitalea rosea]|uniref:Methyltransferase family protein n=2 Tax=Humitalea rosea TaxID=990373 RepID=A0A2W7IGJ7_9PROT|nr:hypothetical protein C8P66_112119 [Humitalea rosea]
MDQRDPTRTAIMAELDSVAAEATDAVGVFMAWPRLLETSARVLRSFGEAGRAMLRDHPILAIARECPAANHSLARPRGYSGDARLIDYLQRHESVSEVLEAATPRGRAILNWTLSLSASEAVRECHALLASLIDQTAERVDDAHVLSATAGHLREASLALDAQSIGRWVAMDEDAETVDEMAESHADLPGLVAVHGGLARLLARPMTHGSFDLAYATGLTQQIDGETVHRLASAMFRSLRSGGRMLIACLTKDLPEAGYMDAYMGWCPPLLDGQDMRTLLDQVPDGPGIRKRVFYGANGRMVYGMIDRPA